MNTRSFSQYESSKSYITWNVCNLINIQQQNWRIKLIVLWWKLISIQTVRKINWRKASYANQFVCSEINEIKFVNIHVLKSMLKEYNSRWHLKRLQWNDRRGDFIILLINYISLRTLFYVFITSLKMLLLSNLVLSDFSVGFSVLQSLCNLKIIYNK